VTGAGVEGVFRATAFEIALNADFRPQALEGLKIDPDVLLNDLSGSSAYRANLIAVLARRAMEKQNQVQSFK
jgi:carbon-monoxide dehydrogenase medium subunit